MPNHSAIVSSYPMHQEKCAEIWKPIPDWPDYGVSNLGRVLSLRTSQPCFLRGSKHRAGHLMIEMQRGNTGERTQRFLHQLVAEIFLGKQPPNTVIRHLDGDPENNSVTNLEYGTIKQNNIERHQHSGRYTGRRNGTRNGVSYTQKPIPSVLESLVIAVQACKNCQKVEIPMALAEEIIRILEK